MAQYLPVLLVSVSAVSIPDLTPDDSVLDTQAINQVDYLSHQWQEADIAKSWRNMTRRKDYIQNGARLENASWRTWWKQRNNLPTISPETLNWLKDSDVTWLYGPLHTASDWAPSRRLSATPDSLIQTSSCIETAPSFSYNAAHVSSQSNSPWALKSILKHRSISELLSVSFPPTPNSELLELEEDPYFKRSSSSGAVHTHVHHSEQANHSRKRPRLIHTKSDTNVHRHNPFRGDSPPLPLIPEDPLPLHEPVQSHESPCSDSNGNSQPPSKRRITFNTFVEQCIAIEKPKKTRDSYYADGDEDQVLDQEGYDEDDEDSDGGENSDDDVLEMRSSIRSRSTGIIRHLSSASSLSTSYGTTHDLTVDREHVTIAPIAPTILKTSASPSPASASRTLYEEDEEIEDVESLFAGMPPPSSYSFEIDQADDDVNLVFAPPQGSVYAECLAMNGDNSSSLNGKEATAAFVRVLSGSPTYMSDPIQAPFFPGEDEDEVLYERRSKTPTASSAFDAEFSKVSPPPSREGSSLTRAAVLKNSSSKDRSSEADVRSIDSKGSGSTSEEGTVVPQTLPVAASSPVTRFSPSSPMKYLDGRDSPSPVRSSIRTARPHFHIHQAPSPARSTTSTGTSTTTTSNGSTSNSYGSPFLEPPSRGRSTSPVTSASPSRDGSQGRSNSIGKRNGSGMSLSDERDRDPPRGRSRSRSIGGSPIEGSVSPRSGSRSRLAAGGLGSMDNLGSYNGGVPKLGSFGSPVWREASLSPEEYDSRGNPRGGRTSRGRRMGSGLVEREKSSSGSSLSPPSHPSPSGSLVKERVSPRVIPKTVDSTSTTVFETPNSNSNAQTGILSSSASVKTILPAVPESPTISPSVPSPESVLIPNTPSKPIDIPAPSSQGVAPKNMLAAPAHLPTPLPDLAGPVTTPTVVEVIHALPVVLPSLIPVPPPTRVITNGSSALSPASSSSTPTTPRAANFEESALSRAMSSARGYLGSLWTSSPGANGERQVQVQHAR